MNERADLDVEIGRRRIVRAAPDRKASQSAHSASFSPFPPCYLLMLTDLSLSSSLLVRLLHERVVRCFRRVQAHELFHEEC